MGRAATEDGAHQCPHHDRMIELTGISGNNGRVGNLERSMKYVKAEHKEDIEEVREDVKDVKKVQAKLMIAACLSATGGGAAGGFIFKLLSGGG